MTKVYELAGKTAGKLYTEFLGNKIELNFRGGMGTSGSNAAVLITSETFIQDAIEEDPRFGSTIILASTYDNPSRARNDYQQHGTPTMGENNQRRAQEAQAAAQAELEASEAEKRAAVRARRQAAKAKKAEAEKAEAEESVTEFKNANEALHYFLAKGIEVTADNLDEMLKAHNCKIVED